MLPTATPAATATATAAWPSPLSWVLERMQKIFAHIHLFGRFRCVSRSSAALGVFARIFSIFARPKKLYFPCFCSGSGTLTESFAIWVKPSVRGMAVSKFFDLEFGYNSAYRGIYNIPYFLQSGERRTQLEGSIT